MSNVRIDDDLYLGMIHKEHCLSDDASPSLEQCNYDYFRFTGMQDEVIEQKRQEINNQQ